MNGFNTKAIHGKALKKDVHGSLRMPVYDSVAFEHENARSLQQTFAGKKPAHVYSRISNPTVEDFEQRIRLLTGGFAVLAVSSGMAAISTVILTLAESGTNIVTTKNLFGNTLSLLERTLGPWGLEVRYVSMTDTDHLASAIDDKTRAVLVESITNPQLEVADIVEVSKVTNRHGVPLLIDNTLMTPYIFNTKSAGGVIELLSSTKYISGGATSVGGVIIDNGTFDWKHSPKLHDLAEKIGPAAFIASLRQEIYRNLGTCMSPHNAYLQTLGLETMGLRIDKSCANTMRLAEHLFGHRKVKAVNYPGLPNSPQHETANHQFSGKCGGILTFDLESEEVCFALMDNLQLIKRATNVNDNKTLILHPATTIFGEYSHDEKLAMGVRPGMLRLSVGIEDYQDLQDDLERGLKAL